MTIRQRMRVFGFGLMVVLGLGIVGQVSAAEALKPFILGSKSGGSVADTLLDTKEALEDQGFEVVGEYAPYPDARVVVVTNDFLKGLAQREDGGVYLMAMRVSIVKSGSEIQVSYMNPDYWRYAYRMRKDVTPVTAKLSAALGSEEQFGAKGLSPRKLKKYHYTFGMEYFDDPIKLGSFGSQAEAVRTVQDNLESGVAGTSEVYRIDVPGQDITLFGVAMTQDMSSDATILAEIDAKPLKHVAHLPYEVAVVEGKVRTLHPRFRIAISWPDLKMVGKNSFYAITKSPEAIKRVLTEVAGGNYESAGGGGGFSVE